MYPARETYIQEHTPRENKRRISQEKTSVYDNDDSGGKYDACFPYYTQDRHGCEITPH